MGQSHTEKAANIAAQIAARPGGTQITIRKATPTHSIRDQRYKANCHPVDVSALTDILDIDPNARLATVEGEATIADLSKATLEHGLLPAVVPEMRKFTIAGLINGEGIQSSSHRYGVFTTTLESVELLLADGSVVTTSATLKPELFSVVPESLGTLGLVIAATIRLVPAKPYVKSMYRRFRTLKEYLAAYKEALGKHDFHEGVIFGPRTFVLLTGDFVDEPGQEALFDPWKPGGTYFYQHVRALMAHTSEASEAIRTQSYLSRSERGRWWTLEGRADLPLLSETAWGRRKLDEFADDVYNKKGFASRGMTALERNRCVVFQDMGVRLEQLGEGIEWVQEHLKVYPVWTCAIHLPEKDRTRLETSHLVDIGIYGEPKVRGYRNVRDMRALQKMVAVPSLWGMSYLTWDEIVAKNPERFEKYERGRLETHADRAFLHIRDKVVWVAPDSPDLGKIPVWRLYDSFGPRWYLNPMAYVSYVIATLSKWIWPRVPAVE
jgi:delta24-sterol reductase